MDKIARNYLLTRDLIDWLSNAAKAKELSASAYLRKLLKEKRAEAEGSQPSTPSTPSA